MIVSEKEKRRKQVKLESEREAIRAQIPAHEQLNDMARFFSLLADPTRLQMVIALRVSELCVQEIAGTIGLSVSAVSHQLRLLKTAKIVKYRRAGKMIYYSLDDDHVEQLIKVALLHVRE